MAQPLAADRRRVLPCAGGDDRVALLRFAAAGARLLNLSANRKGIRVRIQQLAIITLISSAAMLLAACGSDSSSGGAAPPAMQPPPQISLAPGGRAAAVGATVSFDVSATASPTRYQWRRNGVDIPGATMPTYSLVVGLADDGARFSVVVGNSGGEVTSSDALLTVYPVPPLVSTCQSPADLSFAMLPSSPVKTDVQAGAVVGGCKGPLRSVQWTQTAGPSVTLLSDKTAAISFLPSAAGTYSFRADMVDANGTGTSATVDVPVAANTGSTTIAI